MVIFPFSPGHGNVNQGQSLTQQWVIQRAAVSQWVAWTLCTWAAASGRTDPPVGHVSPIHFPHP